MISSHHAEADDVSLVVQDLKPLHAACGRQTRDDSNFTECTHVAVTYDDVTTLDKVLVCLGIIKPAHHGPDSGDGGGDLLDNSGAALVRTDGVGVVTGDGIRHLGGADERESLLEISLIYHIGVCGGDIISGCRCGCTGDAVDSVE